MSCWHESFDVGSHQSGVPGVEAEGTFVLLSETPEANLQRWYKQLSTCKYRSFPRGRKGQSCLFHWEAALGQLIVQNHCFTMVLCASTEKRRLVCRVAQVWLDSAAGSTDLLEGRFFPLIILISIVRRDILMSVKTSVSSLGYVSLLGAPAFPQETAGLLLDLQRELCSERCVLWLARSKCPCR